MWVNKVDMMLILLSAISLFGIIYFAVRLAIKPMLNEPEKVRVIKIKIINSIKDMPEF